MPSILQMIFTPYLNTWIYGFKSICSLNCDKVNYIQFTAKNGSLTDMNTGYNNNH